MRSVKRTVNQYVFAALAVFGFSNLSAQENSPFSRYGLGDIYPSQNIASRGMGGIAAAYSNDQALNTVNPASYGAMRYVRVFGGSKGALVTYDFGISIDARTLRSADPAGTYKSTNFMPSYIQLGIPLSPKAYSKNRGAGLVFGLKPYSRINYSVQQNEYYDNTHTKQTLYEGSGGLNQVFLGLGKRWGNFSIGFNGGYEFGRKSISTKLLFLKDSTNSLNYYKSNSYSTADYWGAFLTPGISYTMKINEVKSKIGSYKEAYFLRLGASGTLQQNLKANNATRSETYTYDSNGGTTPIDSIYETKNTLGTVVIPRTYTAGFMLTKKYMIGKEAVATKWSIGADYSTGDWKNFRYFDQPDNQLESSSMFRAGAEFVPSLLSNNLLNRSTYRVGFYTGNEYANADGNGYNVKALTFGIGFNLRKWSNYDNQSTLINTSLEFGKRGSTVNNVTENFFKFSLGLSLSDLWFTRRKYD
ncbi:MAG TPA: hypothetical protein PLA68_12195 [Panacibacter sp.]|nr:hypothetical protein [Panacibacter sp.]